MFSFMRAGWAFLVERGSLRLDAVALPTYEEWQASASRAPFSELLEGARQGADDTVFMLDGFLEANPGASASEIDSYCRERGAPTYSEMRAKSWETLARVLRRNRISSESEYSLVAEILSDTSARGPNVAERVQLNRLLSEYGRG
jgi:hypothetical protein